VVHAGTLRRVARASDLRGFSAGHFGGQTFFFRDFGMFGYPLAHYHREHSGAVKFLC